MKLIDKIRYDLEDLRDLHIYPKYLKLSTFDYQKLTKEIIDEMWVYDTGDCEIKRYNFGTGMIELYEIEQHSHFVIPEVLACVGDEMEVKEEGKLIYLKDL